MARRIIAVALPHLAAEARLRREGQAGYPDPFAVAGRDRGALRLVSVNRAAAAAGLAPGLGLADARALCPGLLTRPDEPERLAAFRRGLVRWAGRFSPIVSAEDETLTLDASGTAHLFGGEAAMLEAIATALAAHGLTARPAMADTRGAAWALAHYGMDYGSSLPAPPPAPPPRPATDHPPVYHRWLGGEAGRGAERAQAQNNSGGGAGGAARAGAKVNGARPGAKDNDMHSGAKPLPPPQIAPRGQTRAAIAALPVAALRLAPEAAQGLAALGLVTIGDAARIPRGALARRFGLATLKRLDQALGAEPEPVAPARPPPVFAARLTLPEPIGRVDDVMAGLERLLERLCQMLETHQMGARALRLTVRRVDGADAHAAIALARPGRDPTRIRALFEPRVAEVEAGYGIDALRLEATAVEPLKPAQIRPETRLPRGGGMGRGGAPRTPRPGETEAIADLISRVGNRIGFENLLRYLPADSHIPERAFTLAAAAWSETEPWPATPRPRPLTLFPPEPLAVERAFPDTPAPEPGPRPATRDASRPRIRPQIRPGIRSGIRSGTTPEERATPATSAPLPPGGGGMARGGSGPPPRRFRWRRRWLTLSAARGPERLAPEWWWDDPAWRAGLRDYWRAETAEGPRLWLFHTPQAGHRATGPDWWAHGVFA